MNFNKLRSAEFLVSAALLLVSGVFLVESLQLPGGEFDPLGPGAAPEMVASVLLLLCSVVLIRTVRVGSGIAGKIESGENISGSPVDKTPRSLISFFCLLVAYIVAFQFEVAHFVVITTTFVFLATVALRGWDFRSVMIGASVAVILSLLLFLVLTRFFVIRLPGAF
ncbi:MAG: tripartite tricarboxylate transporter TctB family protein [Albidovulum sp.]|nr:tripartite tricarboxylate transporter TctB family protein [Albidovulum sp.]MDE0303402.1 tripartite tricarboxylate transporter TctB family protein [Albidovulum sp.]MDE0532521.1 tripartite tricarboxylate transporter TctB family protein [Albidovulum sp.]